MKLEDLAQINRDAAEVSRTINILGPLAWPLATEALFLEQWAAGNPQIPSPELPSLDQKDAREKLRGLAKGLSTDSPLEKFTLETINSYIDATHLLESVGTKSFEEISQKIYGIPGNIIPGTQITNVDAASKLLGIAKSFDHPYIKEPEACFPAETIKADIEAGSTLLGVDAPEVKIVENFSAKASASLSTVKLRSGTCFSKYDARQLLVHEVLAHSLTAINGSKQPYLQVMGRGAPRTTATQEGLATFSEVITGSIDLARLARLALRIIAIDKALSGADFIDIFKFFIEQGQTPKESFWASARIFRGGIPQGGAVFTKDAVYLDGLLRVTGLFHWALHANRPQTTHLLFCGRLTIDDVFLLEENLVSGEIAGPTYLPTWYQNIECLAGNLAMSSLNTLFDLDALDDFYQNAEESRPH